MPMQNNLTIKKFDPEFEREVLSIMINNSNFAGKFFSLLFSDEDIKKMKTKFFAVEIFRDIAKCYYECYAMNGDSMPSDGMFRNHCSEQFGPEKSGQIFEIVEKIKDLKIESSDYHKEQILKHWQFIKLVALSTDLHMAIEKGKVATLNYMTLFKEHSDMIHSASFDMGETIRFDNPFSIIDQNARMVTDAIQIGIPPLDAIACDGFGFTKSNTLLVFGSSNDGKSMIFSVEVAVNIAKQGKRVLVVNLEGEKFLLPIRVISSYTGIKMSKLDRYANVVDGKVKATCFKEYFSKDEYEKIEESCKILENIEVYHAASSKNRKALNIENIISVVEEKIKAWGIDVVITDYLGISKTDEKSKNDVAAKVHCYKEMDYMAKRHNFLHIAIGQANREGIKEQKGDANNDRRKDKPILREYQLGGGIEIFLDSAFAISISADPEEKKQGIRRLTLLKNRKGIVGTTVEVKGDWASARPLTGEMKVLNDQYEEYADYQKGSQKCGLDQIKGSADSDETSIYDLFGDIVDIKRIMQESDNFLDYSTLYEKIKGYDDKIMAVKNSESGKEAHEKIKNYNIDKETDIEKLKQIQLDSDFIDYFERDLYPKKDKIRNILKENNKKKFNRITKKDLKKATIVFKVLFGEEYRYLDTLVSSEDDPLKEAA